VNKPKEYPIPEGYCEDGDQCKHDFQEIRYEIGIRLVFAAVVPCLNHVGKANAVCVASQFEHMHQVIVQEVGPVPRMFPILRYPYMFN
jgi:hypothetical protein